MTILIENGLDVVKVNELDNKSIWVGLELLEGGISFVFGNDHILRAIPLFVASVT